MDVPGFLPATASGRPIANATVVLTDSEGVTRTAVTSTFGYYTIADVPSGQTYILSVESKRYTFAARTLVVTDELTDADMISDQ